MRYKYTIISACLLSLFLAFCNDKKSNNEYYPSGKLKIEYTEEIDGLSMKKQYDSLGNLQKTIQLKNGIPFGIYQEFDPDGKVSSQATYENGILNGSITEYFNNGKVKFTGEYREGLKNGTFIEYHPNGKIKFKAQIINDTTVSYISFNERDSILKEFNSFRITLTKDTFKIGESLSFYVDTYGELKNKQVTYTVKTNDEFAVLKYNVPPIECTVSINTFCLDSTQFQYFSNPLTKPGSFPVSVTMNINSERSAIIINKTYYVR